LAGTMEATSLWARLNYQRLPLADGGGETGGEALSEAPYTAELRLMAAQECEFGDMPRNLI